VLKDIEEGINRVRTIVSDLRTFTHPDTVQIDRVDVSEVVTASLRFLSHEWKDKVAIHQDVAQDQEIFGNKNKLIQVLVNLLQNSMDALKKKTFTDGEKPAVWIEGRVAQGKSNLIVRDNGEGIDPKDMDKIFDPFFTTKDVGQGMGLGLSICFRIVQEWGGQIRVRSERGKFSEFTLEFPAKSPQ
jgi:signal transduction histidine kinase